MYGYAYHDPRCVIVGSIEERKPMHHPTSRDERRHHRERVVANRRYLWEVIWGMRSGFQINARNNPLYGMGGDEAGWTPDWGRYAKWNLGCGCKQCHAEKYFKDKSKRRKARKSAWSQVECRVGDRRPQKIVCDEADFHNYSEYYQEVEFEL